MSAIAEARTSGSGRQPAAVEATRNVELELATERQESALFAARVEVLARRLEPLAIAVGSRQAEQWISELRYKASRHLAQRSSGTL